MTASLSSLGEGGGAEDDEEREEAALSAWPRPSRRRGRGTERANSPSFGFKVYTTEYQNFLLHLWNSWWEAVVSFWRGTFRPTPEENMHIEIHTGNMHVEFFLQLSST